jgi:putative tricarboxylic transport membrane protein
VTAQSTARSEARTIPVGELAFAGGVVGLGVFALARAHTINQPLAASGMGPRALPYLIGAALLASGSAVLLGVLRGRLGEAEGGEDVAEDDHTDWSTVALLVALFVVHIFLIVPVGWPIAAAVLFTGCAWTFGAKPRWRAAVIGMVLALVLQLVFAGGLGVSLPPGPLLEGVSFLHG